MDGRLQKAGFSLLESGFTDKQGEEARMICVATVVVETSV